MKVETSFLIPLHFEFSFCSLSIVFWTPEWPVTALCACCIFLNIFVDKYSRFSIMLVCSKLFSVICVSCLDGNGTNLDRVSASMFCLPSMCKTSKLKCCIAIFHLLTLSLCSVFMWLKIFESVCKIKYWSLNSDRGLYLLSVCGLLISLVLSKC